MKTTFRGLLLTCLCILTLGASAQTTGMATGSDGTSICYKVYGDGKPLLIINGGPGMNSEGFEGLAKKMSGRYQAIIYDQRGTGRSVLAAIDTHTVTMKLMIDDIESIRKHLGIKQWSVLGHSFGGMLASFYATQFPENIDKMILSSSGGIDLGLLNYVRKSIDSKLSKTDLDSISYWTKKIEEGDSSHAARLERGRHLAPAYVVDKKYLPVIAERLTQGNGLINELLWTDMQKMHFNCASELRFFNKPVLIIQGRQDIIRKETAEKAHRVLSHSKVVYMDHCGHYGWLDNEHIFFQSVFNFLE